MLNHNKQAQLLEIAVRFRCSDPPGFFMLSKMNFYYVYIMIMVTIAPPALDDHYYTVFINNIIKIIPMSVVIITRLHNCSVICQSQV